MKILFLVHVEEMFRDYFPDRMYISRLLRAMSLYDKVIFLISEVQDYCPICELDQSGYRYTQWTWGWGYEKDMFNEDESTWVIPANGHEWTWVPPELRTDHWNKHEISVGGGGMGECLQDFIDVLDHVEIDHRVVNGYCY